MNLIDTTRKPGAGMVKGIAMGRKKYAYRGDTIDILCDDGNTVTFSAGQYSIRRSFVVDNRLVMRIYWRNGKVQVLTINPKHLFKLAARGLNWRIHSLLNSLAKNGHKNLTLEDKARWVNRLAITLEHGAWRISKKYYEYVEGYAPQVAKPDPNNPENPES